MNEEEEVVEEEEEDGERMDGRGLCAQGSLAPDSIIHPHTLQPLFSTPCNLHAHCSLGPIYATQFRRANQFIIQQGCNHIIRILFPCENLALT